MIQTRLSPIQKKKRDETLKQILRSIPEDTWNTLLQKRLIIYIDNAGGDHWNCVFILNLRSYIMK